MSVNICGDDQFAIIEAYKKKLIEATNIKDSPEEMAVIDNILFRFWQMGWLPKLPHGRLIDADALTGQMERNLWAIEDKAEKELGFDETLRRGMQYGHAVCLNAVNDATVIFVPQIVHCCECEYNNHCLTQEFVEDASKIPFDKNTWFCADAKAATTIIPAEDGDGDV